MSAPRNVFDLIEPAVEAPRAPIKADPKKRNVFDIPPDESTWVKEPAPSISEQLETTPGLIAREAAAGLYSLPSNLAESYRFIGGKLQQLGEETAAKEGREVTDQEREMTNKIVNYLPDLVKTLGEKFPSVFPTFAQAEEKIGKKIEEHEGIKLPKEARGVIEKAGIGFAKALPIAVMPGSALVKGIALGTSATTEALDLSEKNKLLGNIGIPALTQLIQAVATKRYVPSGAEAARLLQAGERLGMTQAELAPILATEQQVSRHARRAASIPGTKKAFEKTGQALGDQLTALQSNPAAQASLSAAAETSLTNKLKGILRDIRGRTHAHSPEEISAMNFIETAIKDIQNHGSTPSQLIGLQRSLNRVKEGRTELRRLVDPIREGIESVSPQLAKDFADTNLMYSRYVKNLNEISPTTFNHFIDAGELQQMLGAVFTLNPGIASRGLIKAGTLKGFEKISSLIVTNPTAQSLVRNFKKAVKDGSKSSALALGVQLKEYIKENLPEEENTIDWKKLGIED